MATIVARDRAASVLIPGIVLAGGASTRMGRPKALLPLADGTFISHLISTLRSSGLEDVVVVTGVHDAEIRRDVEALGLPGVRVVHNVHHADGQISSLRAALRAVDHPGVSAALVVLVDHPLVEVKTVRRLVDVWVACRAPVVRPVYKGRHGHPIVFGRATFESLWTAPIAEGARAVVRSLGDAVRDEPVDDPGVCVDIDTPGDYERAVRGRF